MHALGIDEAMIRHCVLLLGKVSLGNFIQARAWIRPNLKNITLFSPVPLRAVRKGYQRVTLQQ
jgi:hypothetical protein